MLHTDVRPETIVAAVLYLITAYQRCRCPDVAACIARRLQDLHQHPRADRLVRDVAAASIAVWEAAARQLPTPAATNSGMSGFTVH